MPLLLVFLWRGRNRAVYAGVFLVVGALELYGTAIGTWHWARRPPGLGIPDGNPPSGVASGYVWFDVMALLVAPYLVGITWRSPATDDFRAQPARVSLSMKLLLTSAGIKNPSISDALVELLGKPIAESNALCIPTAVVRAPPCRPSPGVAVHQRAGDRHSDGRTGLEVHGSAGAHRPAEPR